jgi:hypothetical protein
MRDKMDTENITAIKEERNLDYYYKIAKFLFIVLIVPALGVFAVNQALEFRYKSVLLQTPCTVCMDLNPAVKDCMVRKDTLYSDKDGTWKTLDNWNNISIEFNDTLK